MLIYKVTNKINNKVYIGQTKNTLNYRMNQHYRSAKTKDDNNYFHNALKKYKKEDFIWGKVYECDNLDELNEKEIYYISFYNSANRDHGYNRKFGGEQGKCNDDTKKLLRISTSKLWNDDNVDRQKRMLEGLRKGTKIVKENAKHNFIKRTCPTCNKVFKIKPFEKKKYCSYKCASKLIDYNKGLNKANIVNKEKRKKEKLLLYNIIINWVKNNANILDDVKYNNLKFVDNIVKLTKYKDSRCLYPILNTKNKKDFVKELVKISKNIC